MAVDRSFGAGAAMPFSSHTLFATYLTPSLPFRRRRQSSTDSDASTSSPSGSPPESTDSYLEGHTSHLRCARCLADLALSHQIISKGFTGRHGRAYLVAPSQASISNPFTRTHERDRSLPNLPNTYTNKPVPRQLVTGAHTVGDINCSQCGSNLGWKYVAAEDEAQRYKVGKFILETKKVMRSSTWENSDDEVEAHERFEHQRRRRSSAAPPSNEMTAVPEGEMEFDSQDEDECEDLFMGVWTPQLAAQRRKAKRFGRAED
jgi:hypothetical protein